MPFHGKDQGLKILGPHLPAFSEIVFGVIDEFYSTFGDYLHGFESWTQRSMVRDMMKERMIAYCEQTPGLDFQRRGNVTTFAGHNTFTWKVKKLDDHLRIAKAHSQAALNFNRNDGAQGELMPDIDLTKLYIGYVPTENDPLNPPVYIVCNDEFGAVAWVIKLERPEPPPAHTLSRPSDGGTPTKSRVRIKKQRKTGTDE